MGAQASTKPCERKPSSPSSAPSWKTSRATPKAADVARRLRRTAATAASGARSSTVRSTNPRAMITPTTSGSLRDERALQVAALGRRPADQRRGREPVAHRVDRGGQRAGPLAGDRHRGEQHAAARPPAHRDGRDPGIASQDGGGARLVALCRR